MGKRLGIFCAVIVLSIATTGCDASQKMIEKSGISNNPNYINYLKNKADGNITADDLSVNAIPYEYDEEFVIPENSIHITFAQNSNINVTYYTDSQFTTPINVNEYYLTNGQTLYAKSSVSDTVKNDMYEFYGYNVYEYSEDMNGNLTRKLKNCVTNGSYAIIEFEESLIGKELSIEPIGQYKNRVITLNDYYLDDTDNKHELEGIWFINGTEAQGTSTEIGPNTSYIISYKYDSDLYYLFNTSPNYFYNDPIDGLVVFEQRNPEDETIAYDVELKSYSSFALLSSADRTVWYNDVETKILANGSFEISKLTYGQEIKIETDKEWESLRLEEELLLINESVSPDGKFTYTLSVHTPGAEFYFDPSDYNYEHGDITFTCFGKEITEPKLLPYGVTVYCTAKKVNEGYSFPESYAIKISDNDTITKADLENLPFSEVVHVKVALNQPNYGGEIVYSFKDEILTKTSVELDSGDVINMKFNSWEGWYINNDALEQYQVTEDSNQIAQAGTVNISDIFIEDENHKPKLDVYLDKSIGTNMTISVKDYAPDSIKYDNWIMDEHIVDEAQMSTTAEGVVITAEGSALQSGKALKVEMVKKTTDNTKITKAWYYKEINLKDKAFPIYDSLSTDKDWYKSIKVTLSVVDISVFKSSLINCDNTLISIKNADTRNELKDGDLIEPSTKIILKIRPAAGYYLEDTDNYYEKEMKYSAFEDDISDILEDHAPHKNITVTLDKSDSYATYTYEIKTGVFSYSPVTGTVNQNGSITVSLKEGDVIQLTYEITDDSHKLDNSYGITFSHTKATKTIEITSDMDTQTLTRVDFGIE